MAILFPTSSNERFDELADTVPVFNAETIDQYRTKQ